MKFPSSIGEKKIIWKMRTQYVRWWWDLWRKKEGGGWIGRGECYFILENQEKSHRKEKYDQRLDEIDSQ